MPVEILTQFFTVFDQDKLRAQIGQLDKLCEQPNFWSDAKKAGEVLKQKKQLEQTLSTIKELKDRLDIALMLFDDIVASKTIDENFEQEILTLYTEAKKLKSTVLLSGEYDSNNAILSIQAGAGGVDSQDWAQMLLRMYVQFASKNGYTATIIDKEDGAEAGIKGATLLLSGPNAFGYLKNESGVHRLVRISPFDSNARRHTSFASVEISPEIDEQTDIDIKKEDLRIDTFRSGGAGGQHVNKTDSAVRLTHVPSGIVVVCQSERSSHQNKDLAMKVLYSRLVAKNEREKQAQKDLKNANLKKIEWGSQIRSYVMCPYTMVKDHRNNFETSDVAGVLDGDLMDFLQEMILSQNI